MKVIYLLSRSRPMTSLNRDSYVRAGWLLHQVVRPDTMSNPYLLIKLVFFTTHGLVEPPFWLPAYARPGAYFKFSYSETLSTSSWTPRSSTKIQLHSESVSYTHLTLPTKA